MGTTIKRRRPHARLKPVATMIPAELRRLRQWVCWVYELRDDKWTKVPKRPTQAWASSTDPNTWSSFEACIDVYEQGRIKPDGIGFVVSPADGYMMIDLDHVRDLATGTFEPWAQAIIHAALYDGVYLEMSPSGTGLHIIGRGAKDITEKSAQVELYTRDRFFTISRAIWPEKLPKKLGTLDRTLKLALARAAATKSMSGKTKLAPKDMSPAEAAPSPYPKTWSDDDILKVALKSAQGPKLRRLLDGDYAEFQNDASAGEFALASMLGWWFHLDADRVEDVMHAHGAYRDKWDSPRPRDKWGIKRDGYTYLRYTVDWALAGQTSYYQKDERPQINDAWNERRWHQAVAAHVKGGPV